MLQEISKYWLKQSTYDTAVGIYATFPLIMVTALLVVNAPYGKYTHYVMGKGVTLSYQADLQEN